jgi:hypothetical protein
VGSILWRWTSECLDHVWYIYDIKNYRIKIKIFLLHNILTTYKYGDRSVYCMTWTQSQILREGFTTNYKVLKKLTSRYDEYHSCLMFRSYWLEYPLEDRFILKNKGGFTHSIQKTDNILTSCSQFIITLKSSFYIRPIWVKRLAKRR